MRAATIWMGLAVFMAVPSRADVVSGAGLTIGQQVVVTGTMTVQGNAFSVGGSTLVVTGGKVGMGTTSPGSSLQVGNVEQSVIAANANLSVSGAVNSTGPLRSCDAGTSYACGQLDADNTAVYLRATYLNAAQNLPLVFHTSISGMVAERMRIHTNGNLGIGTASPLAKLSVTGDASVSGASTFGGTMTVRGSGLTPSNGITLHDTGTDSNPAIQVKNDVQAWNFQTVGARNDALELFDATCGGAASCAVARFQTNANGSGLTILGASTFESSPTFKNGAFSVAQDTFSVSGGQVNIGASGVAKLGNQYGLTVTSNVYLTPGGGRPAGIVLDDNAQAANGRLWQVANSGTDFIIRTLNDAQSASANALTCDRSASGTTVNSCTFDTDLLLNGGATAIAINESDGGNIAANIEANTTRGLIELKSGGVTTIQMSGGSEANYFNGGGNVGVGTASPLAKLHNTGNLSQVGASTFQSSATFRAASGAQEQALFATPDYVAGSTGSSLLIQAGAASGNTYMNLNAYQNGGAAYGVLRLQDGGGQVVVGNTATFESSVTIKNDALWVAGSTITIAEATSVSGATITISNSVRTRGLWSVVASSSPSGGTSLIGFSGLRSSATYRLELSVWHKIAAGRYYLRFNGDGGSNYIGAQMMVQSANATLNGQNGPGDACQLTFLTDSQTTSDGASWTVTFRTAPGDSKRVFAYFDGVYSQSSSNWDRIDGLCRYQGSSELSQVTLYVSAGQFIGDVRLLELVN